MGETTGIAWTRSSWSPWIGCTEVSPGCDHCYARELDKRHRYGGAVHWGVGVPRYRTKPGNWKQPHAWNGQAERSGERWTVFPSLCDPFDNEVPEEWRRDFWQLIHETPSLTYLLLSKRIGNAAKMLPPFSAERLPNVWLGASVVNQEEADRDVPKLLATPAAKRFVSYEPAIAAIDFAAYLPQPGLRDLIATFPKGAFPLPAHLTPRPALDWLIVGGESRQGGYDGRPFNIEWARSTIKQCRAAGLPVFIKQLGHLPHGALNNVHPLPHEVVYLKDRAGADPAEWPADLQVQELPA